VQLPISGHPLHTRSLTIGVRLREDGRWQVRGDIIDLRKCSFVPMLTDIQPAGIIHNMSIELVLDPATSRIDSLQVDQPVVAIERSKTSRGECCRDPAPRLKALEGESLDGEFARRLGSAFGGPRGCSHLLTLFQLMASGLRRAISLESTLASALERPINDCLFWRSVFVEGFESEAEEGALEMVVQLADFHSQPLEAGAPPTQRLASQADVRLFARAAGPERKLSDVRVADRERSYETLATAEWRDVSDRFAGLVGAKMVGGLAGKLFSILDQPADRVLLDACLQLAPGYIQVLAAVMDRWLVQMKQVSSGAGDAEISPGIAEADNVGGLPDSCYMWRSDGPLVSLRGVRRDAG
jgi:hypothetical protein